MAADADHDALISQLSSLTGLDPPVAAEYLREQDWNVEAAASEYYASLDVAQDPEPEAETPEEDLTASSAGAGHRLDGSGPSAAAMTNDEPSTSRQAPKKKFATLGDLNSGASGAASGAHGGGDDDDSDDDYPPDMFAGGEKSGLAVQNPDDLKRKIFERAKKSAPRPGGDEAPEPTNHFRGTARTLGGDEEPSRIIDDPHADTPGRSRPERVQRRLHFWADGFSVDDGPLYRNDDPANARILALIRTGRAPLSIMDVSPDQEVDVQLEQHEEKYVAPKKKYKPFSGSGQRLGSPTPGADVSAQTPTTSFTTASSAQPLAPDSQTTVQLDGSQPTVSLQIRLGDGTRLVSRFNLSHTIGDIYDFVSSANPASQQRSWVLMTTFPSKELSDRAAVLGDLAELKKGGTVVQKYT